MNWAIFTENDNEYWAGLYITQAEAEDDLHGRPEGCHVAQACECVIGITRPASECMVCSMREEYADAE
jgi:hypothetical protein